MPKISRFMILALAASTLLPGWSAMAIAVTPGTDASADDTCGFFNVIEIADPPGDATPGSPAFVDILGLKIRQMGQYVQFEWLAAANPVNSDGLGYLVALDTDRNPATGQQWGDVGADLKISIETFPEGPTAEMVLAYIAPDGDTVLKQERDDRVQLTDTGFVLNIEKSKIPADHLDLNFFAGGGAWRDEALPTEIHLQPAGDPIHISITSANTVLESKPGLINIPSKAAGVQLSASLVSNGSSTLLDPSQVEYAISHNASHVISNPESIISIDDNGIAHYNSEGYVSVTTTTAACHLTSEKIILATGEKYGDPATDDVIAVFPTNYVPDSSSFSFGDMMADYPNYIYTVNLAYDVTSDLYHGFIPLDGDKQIFAPLVLEGHCGGAGNPLETAPCCYMNCGSGEPMYGVVIHEMAHNFQLAPGMSQLLWSNEGRFGNERVFECIASLPLIYFFNEISQNGGQYGLGPGTFEWSYMDDYAQSDRGGWETFEEFEQLIATGQSAGFFDNRGLFESVGIFCAFFQSYMYDHDGHSTAYGHNMIRRFLNIFDKDEIPDFQEDKVETYFAAAFSISAGSDEREQLRHWGFTIDDAFYEQIEPTLAAKLIAEPGLIFRNSFEGGGTP